MKPKRIENPELLEKLREDPCICCGLRPVDVHHIRTRGAGGDDIGSNLLSLCRRHHEMIHRVGLNQMAERFPSLLEALTKKGWEYDSNRNKWI